MIILSQYITQLIILEGSLSDPHESEADSLTFQN